MTPKVLQNKKHSPLVTPRYMLGTAKRGWPLLVLFFIMFMFIFTLPVALKLPSLQLSIQGGEHVGQHWTHERIIEELSNNIFVLLMIGSVLSAVAAVFSGVYFMQFMQSKKSAGFFHSLPEKRSGHFISAVFSSAAVYIAAMLPNFIFTLLIFAAHGFFYAELIPSFLSVLGFGLFYFIVFLSIAMLAGAISGNRVIHTIMTAFLLFALPVVFISLMLLLNHGSSYLDVISLAGSLEVHKWLSPVSRAVYVLTSNWGITKWVLIAFDTVMTAAFFALAYFAYTKRPIERSGNPIVFAPLGEIVKYIIIGPSAVLLSELFDIFSDGWGIFGFVAGLLLSYMLCNTVLNRSAKAMFSHIRGMAIYSVSFITASIIISVGCFGIFDYAVPVSSGITIDFSGSGIVNRGDVTVSDPDDIKAVRQAMTELTSGLRDGRYRDNLPYISGEYHFEGSPDPDKLRTISMTIVYKSPLGFDIPYNYYDVEYDAIIPLIDIIIDSGLDKDTRLWEEDVTLDIGMRIILSTSHFDLDPSQDDLRDLLGYAEISAAADSPDDRGRALFSHEAGGYQKFSVGRADLSNGSAYNVTPIFSDDLLKIKALMSGSNYTKPYVTSCGPAGYIYENTADNIFKLTEEKYFDALAKTIDEIEVYSHVTGESTSFTGDKIRAILPCLASVSGDYVSVFTKTDSDYTVYIKAKSDLSLYDEKYEDAVAAEKYDTYSYEYRVTWFLEGMAPDFVK